MPRSVISRKGWPHHIVGGGVLVLGCQAKLSDLLIKEKHWLMILFAPVKRGQGKGSRVRCPCCPFPGKMVCWTWTGIGHISTQC